MGREKGKERKKKLVIPKSTKADLSREREVEEWNGDYRGCRNSDPMRGRSVESG